MAEEFEIDLDAVKDLDSAKAIIRVLLARMKVLEEKVARLEKNSSTSSKPPSSDITKPTHEQRQPGKRKSGGQPHHKGKTRSLLPPEEVDDTLDLPIEHCPKCGCGIEKREEILIQQTVELREDPVEVMQYNRHSGWCRSCNAVRYAPLPTGVAEGQAYGPRLQALLGYMKGNLGASYTELSQFCTDVLGVAISRGAVCSVVSRVSGALTKPYDEVSAHIREEKALHIDESGWRDSGKQYWIWVFCTSLIAFFTIERSRGSVVLKKILGEVFDGAITSDFYSAYVSYANESQQFCLAHLIRDIKFLTMLPDDATRVFGERMLGYFKLLFHHWHARDQMPCDVFLKHCDMLERRIFTFLYRRDVPTGPATTLKKRFVKHQDSIFRFVHNPSLFEPTNNEAERILRSFVRIRRQTQGSRSEWGRMWSSRIMTVITSCRKQNRSPWRFILDSVNSHYSQSKSPSLLPS